MKKTYTILCIGFVILSVLAFPNAPTMDDWSYLTSPQIDAPLLDLLMPINTYWRPFDGIIGYVNGLNTRLFPLINHILIVAGHIMNCFLVFKLSSIIGLRKKGAIAAMVFFMFSPGMLGAVLDIDSANQVYSLLWGLVATIVYLRGAMRANESEEIRRVAYTLFMTCIFIATLCKENGLAFIVAAPLMAFGSGIRTFRSCCRDVAVFMLIPVVYAVVRFSLPMDNVELNGDYIEGGMYRWVRNVAMFLTFSWLPWDFVCMIHRPNRNVMLALVSIALSLPFVVCALRYVLSSIRERLTYSLLASMLVIAGIHLVTIFTVMHTYSSLSMAALLVGLMVQRLAKPGYVLAVCFSFLASAALSDVHHAVKAYESGERGRIMALSAISQCKGKPDKVLVVCVDNGYPKYSMFCTIPVDAFGWGIAAKYENAYEWPNMIKREEITVEEQYKLEGIIADAFARNFDSVWIVEGEKVMVENKTE